MQMTSGCSSRMPYISNHLTGFYLLPCDGTNAGAMGIEGGKSAAVVDFDMVPITAAPTVGGVGNGHSTSCSSQNRSAFWDSNVSTTIEVESPKDFDRVARKWNVDYAFYKTGPDKYLLFFKSGQADAITACFSEYSRRVMKRSKSRRVPIREQLKRAAAELARQPSHKKERAREAVHEDR